MPICSICGTTIEADAKFCAECGAGVGNEEEMDVSETMIAMAAEYERKVRENPEDTSARYDLGLARMYERKWGRAAEQFQRVIDLQPEFADAHANLSVCLSKLGQPDRALEEAETAIELDPGKKRYRKIKRQLTGRTH
ncbi:MAG: tetratricopeptide repeat protein [candidate division WS1 bacterium]|jgi:tetratricopeptide (TPR) repeat protein|nr:tetratricopeptide repeat protein [candidate division WS1 bacterium]